MKSKYQLKYIFYGASIYSLGEVLVKASGFFLIPVYTRVLNPSEYGIIGYLQVLLQIMTTILSLGFNGAQTRYYFDMKDDKKKFGQFLFSINSFPILFFVFITLPLTYISKKLNFSIGQSQIPIYPYVSLILVTASFQIMASNAVSYYRVTKNYIYATLLQVGRFLFITAFTIYFIVTLKLGALGRVLGLASGVSLFLVLTSWGYWKKFVPKFSKEAIIFALAYGVPVVLHRLASTLHNTIDRLVLEQFVSLDDLGIYTVAFSIGNVFNVFLMSFNQAYQPNYFELMTSQEEDKHSKIIKTYKIWIIMISLVAIGAILLGGPFLRVFSGEKYIKTIDIFPWLIVSVFFGSFYYFFSSPIFLYKKTKILPLITVTSAVINIVLNFLLIPQYGIVGAAFSTIVSHIYMSAIAYAIGQRLLKIKWPMFITFISALFVLLAFLYTIL